VIPSEGSASARGSGGGRVLSRRQLLASAAGGLVGLVAAGVVGYEWPHAAGPGASQSGAEEASGAVDSFVSRPDLRPPRVRVQRLGPVADPGRRIFLALRYAPGMSGQQGLAIVDYAGRLVWFRPVAGADPFDCDAQRYRGQPVLTWWQGTVVAGHGAGVGEMADASYRRLATIRAGDGLAADLHELNLTARGTALVTAYETVTADLSRLGGSRRAAVLAGHAQEIDLATGAVLFDWDSLRHVGVEESYLPLPSGASVPYDYFHINSVAETPDGNLLVSARNTWALYKVDRSSGEVLWRLNGKRSDFSVAKQARFYWQHDARMPDPATLTVFDDGASPPEERQSRALLLDVDARAMHVRLRRAYLHPARFLAANQGSMQLLPGGHVFVGWGNQPYFSEFAPDGALVLDGELPLGVRSYRAFSHPWVGRPLEPPAVALRANPAGGTTVYASWNGATQVATWLVLAGPSASSLAPVGSQPWSGFETAIAVASSGPYFAVVALDASGRELRRSGIVRL